MLMMILNDAPRRSLSKIYAAGGISIEKRCEDFIFEFPEALQEPPANPPQKNDPLPRDQKWRIRGSHTYVCLYIYVYPIYIYIYICSKNTSGKEGISFFFFESMEFEVKFKSLAPIIQFPQNYGGKANPPSGVSSLVDQVSLCYTLLFLLKLIFCTSFVFSILEPSKIKNIMFQMVFYYLWDIFRRCGYMSPHSYRFLYISPVLISWKFQRAGRIATWRFPTPSSHCRWSWRVPGRRGWGPLRSGFLG